jgi:hypothetical protein
MPKEELDFATTCGALQSYFYGSASFLSTRQSNFDWRKINLAPNAIGSYWHYRGTNKYWSMREILCST